MSKGWGLLYIYLWSFIVIEIAIGVLG